MLDHIRPVLDQGKPVPGMAVCDAGPQSDGALRVSIHGDTITITALMARGTFPATVQLPLSRLFALITEAVRTAPVHDNGHYRA